MGGSFSGLELRRVHARKLSLRLSGASSVATAGWSCCFSGCGRAEASGLRSQSVLAVVSGASHALRHVQEDPMAIVTETSILE